MDKDLALLLGTHSVRKRWKMVVNNTDVFELATFAYPARREICFPHDDLAWHKNEAILKHKSYNVRKIKVTDIIHMTQRAGNSII